MLNEKGPVLHRPFFHAQMTMIPVGIERGRHGQADCKVLGV